MSISLSLCYITPIAAGGLSGMRRWTWGAASLVVVVAYNLALGSLALAQRQEMLARALHDADIASAALTAQLEENLNLVDRTLSGIAEVLKVAPEVRQPRSPYAHRLLVRRHAITPIFDNLVLVGPDGRLRNTSASTDVPALDLSDRDYVKIHLDGDQDNLFIGIPIRSRLNDAWIIPVSHAVQDEFGRLSMVVGGAMDPDAVRGMLSARRLPDGFRAAVILPSGHALGCQGLTGCQVGTVLDRAVFDRDEAHGEDTAYLPGGPGPGAYMRGPRYGVVAVVSADREVILAPWLASMPVFGGLAVLGSLALVVGTMVMYRQVRARALALAALAEANASLERRVAERTRQLSESEERLRSFIWAARDAVVIIDDAGMVSEFNPAAVGLFGYQADEVVGHSVNMLMPDAFAREHDRHIRRGRRPGQHPVGKEREMVGRHKDGHEFPIELTVGTHAVDGCRLHVGVIRDITERKANDDELRRRANIDALTGVFNRRSFVEEGERLVALARRHERPVAVLMIDADHFKSVNDTHGHDVGDVVLRAMAATVAGALRDTDVFGRLGGEEFAALLPETDAAGAEALAWAIVRAVRGLAVPLPGGGELRFTVSIGIGGGSASGLDALLKQADLALYAAKNAGRDRVAVAPDLAGAD